MHREVKGQNRVDRIQNIISSKADNAYSLHAIHVSIRFCHILILTSLLVLLGPVLQGSCVTAQELGRTKV